MITRRWLLIALIVLAGCAKGEKMSTADFVKQVATEARTKMRVQVVIRTAGNEPSADEQALLGTLEKAIERRNVGWIVSSGAQPGTMFITVEVENTADATTKLRTILKEAGVRERSSFRIIQPE